MTAKEMFEKLGYELEEEKTPFGFVLSYKKQDNFNGKEYIQFRSGSVNDLVKIFYENFKLQRKDKNLSREELQAINKQCEELRWK